VRSGQGSNFWTPIIQRGDNGRHTITVLGFDEVENNAAQPESKDRKLLDPVSHEYS
jgi:hypothetical protein